MAYLIDDALHLILMACDIDTLQNFIINKHMLFYCNKQFWQNKLLHDHLPTINSDYNPIKEYKLLQRAYRLAEEIIILNKNPLTWRDTVIDINFTRLPNTYSNLALLSPLLHNQLLNFNMKEYDLPSESICIKLKNNTYIMNYRIQGYDSGEAYLKLKENIDESTAKDIITKIIFDGKMHYDGLMFKNHYFLFDSYYFTHINVTDDHDTAFLVFKDYLQIDRDRAIYEYSYG